MRRWLFALWASALVLWLGGSTFAAETTASLAEKLKSDDFKVRTQAALSLGASADEAAVKPLCDALADANASVKTAAAAALGKLGKASGLKCLETAATKETIADVKSAIQKSIDSLKATGTSASSASTTTAPPPPSKDTKFYVAIEVTNKTTRPATEIETIVRSAAQAKLVAKSGYAMAPKGETVAQGGQVVKSKKLKGYILLATVEAPTYANGSLSVKMTVTMATYPDKSIVASFTPKVTQSNTPTTDKKSEDALVKLCAESALESLFKVAAAQ